MPKFDPYPGVLDIPRVWVNAVRQDSVKTVAASAVVASGIATFYLTDDGTATGIAIFTSPDQETANFWVNDNAAGYQFGSYTVSANKKVLTVSVTKVTATSANALLNLLGGTISVLTGITFTNAANGTVVNVTISGD